LNRETVLRTVLAAVVIIVIMWGWPRVAERLWPPEKRPEAPTAPAPKPAETSEPPAEVPAATPAETPAAPATPPQPPAEVQAPAAAPSSAPVLRAVGAEGAVPPPIVLGSAAADSRFDMEIEVTARGAAIERLALARGTGFFKTVGDRRKPAEQREPMELVVGDGAFSAFTIPELRVRLKGAEAWSKVDLSEVVWKVETAETSPTQAVFSTTVQDEAGRTILRVRKTFSLRALSRSRALSGGEVPPYQLHLSIEMVPARGRVEKVA